MKKSQPIIKKKLYQAYYLLLALILVGQVIYTLYQTSLMVAHSQHQQKYQAQIEQFQAEKEQLQRELAKVNSIHSLRQTAEEADFELITQTITLKPKTNLASAE